MLSAPWTQIGQIQTEISDLKQRVSMKGDSHQIHALNHKLDSLEHSVREIRADLANFRIRLQAIEEGEIAKQAVMEEKP